MSLKITWLLGKMSSVELEACAAELLSRLESGASSGRAAENFEGVEWAAAHSGSGERFPRPGAGKTEKGPEETGGGEFAPGKAGGTLKFYLGSPAERDIEVPAGTECMTRAGTAFVTTGDGVIQAGESFCRVSARALAAGSGGNVPAGSVVYIKLSPPGVAGVLNEAAFSGGAEAEGDDGLRERVLSSYRSLPNGANEAYYRGKVLNIPGVAAVTVLPRNRGIGTVDIIFSGDGGAPSAELVEQVRETLEAEREICVDIDVRPAEVKTVNVSAAISVAPGYDLDAVKADAEKALRGYFNGRLLGRGVFRARLGAILMSVEGLENYVLSAPAADVAAETGKLPVLGALNISGAV